MMCPVHAEDWTGLGIAESATFSVAPWRKRRNMTHVQRGSQIGTCTHRDAHNQQSAIGSSANYNTTTVSTTLNCLPNDSPIVGSSSSTEERVRPHEGPSREGEGFGLESFAQGLSETKLHSSPRPMYPSTWDIRHYPCIIWRLRVQARGRRP